MLINNIGGIFGGINSLVVNNSYIKQQFMYIIREFPPLPLLLTPPGRQPRGGWRALSESKLFSWLESKQHVPCYLSKRPVS